MKREGISLGNEMKSWAFNAEEECMKLMCVRQTGKYRGYIEQIWTKANNEYGTPQAKERKFEKWSCSFL